jgi:predicted Fe-Mo cluster-binding NifX family protein
MPPLEQSFKANPHRRPLQVLRKSAIMKICIPVATPCGLHAALEPDFSGARHLIVADTEDDTVRLLDRQQWRTGDDEIVSGIQAVFCTQVEPGIARDLQANGIQVHLCEASSAGDVLAQFRAGQLQPLPPLSAAQGRCCCGGHHDHAQEHRHEHEDVGGCGGHGGCACRH